MIRLLIFDLDGTLVDTGEDLAASANDACGRVAGRPPRSVTQVTSYIGDGARTLIERCLGPDHLHQADETLRVFMEHYDRHLLDRTRLYPEVRETLDRLSGCEKGVLTNKPERPARLILEGLRIDGYFRQIIGGDTGSTKKPDPSGALALCVALATKPRETLIIGDSATDVRTGKAAGIRTVGVTWGFGNVEEMRAAGVDFLIPRLADLIPLLERLTTP